MFDEKGIGVAQTAAFGGLRLCVFAASGAIGSLFEQSISGEQGARLLLESPEHKIPTSISHDGRFLLYTSVNIGPTRCDVWVLPLTGERKLYPLIRRAFDQHSAQFSPDGRRVAYVSNDSGRLEVLVRPFAPVSTSDAESAGETVIVSKSGGTAPDGEPMARSSSSSRRKAQSPQFL